MTRDSSCSGSTSTTSARTRGASWTSTALTYPVVYDGKGSTVGKWGVRGFPETFFVDRSGKLVGERISGPVDIERNRDAYERGIALALGSKQ